MTDWVDEQLYSDLRLGLKNVETLFDSKTEHQRMILFRNPAFGRVLTLDGVTQTTEGDEFIYHEMLTHVPVLAHGNVGRALIVGGGDGGMAEELLKHTGIEHVTMVEIDESVIEFSQQHLPMICGRVFDDPRLHVHIGDGAAFMAESEESFDLIIVDSTDPIGPGEALFTNTFYANCKARLKPGGVLVTQNGVPFLQPDELTKTIQALSGLFEDATCYLATVPTYVGGPMALGWATDDASLRDVPLEVLKERFQAWGAETRCYTPAVHKAAFALPPYISKLIY
jgi:spermidine synthase